MCNWRHSTPEGVPSGKRQLSPTLEAVSSFLGAAPPGGAGESAAKGAVNADLVDCAAKALLCNLSRDGSGPPCDAPDERFDSASVPQIPLRTYLQRLFKAFRCTDASFVCALVLLDRLLDGAGGASALRLTPRNVHRLFFSCAVLATKYNEDQTWCNWDFARIGGIDLEDLNEYEMFLFSKLGFKLAVNFDEFELYRAFLTALADPSLALPADFSSGGGAGGGRASFVAQGAGKAAAPTVVPSAGAPAPAPAAAAAPASRQACCTSAVTGLGRLLQQWTSGRAAATRGASGPWRARH